MSILKNNGINIGSGNPSSIANGDLKRDGTTLYIRDGGAWHSVGGGGGGVYSSGFYDARANWSFNTGLNETTNYCWYGRSGVQFAGTGTSFSGNGTSADYTQNVGWMAAGV